MDLKQLRSFTERYLHEMECQIVESTPAYIQVQLSISADKDLLNRPFYWMYVERMGIEPTPVQLCFVFEPDQFPKDKRGEYLFFGCPRFTQMVRSAQKHGRYVRLYEKPKPIEPFFKPSKAYTPWLCINFKVSYVCDQKKDAIRSLGINLRSGEIKDNFYTTLKQKHWTNKLPDHRYTLPPAFSYMEAVSELEYYLHEQLEREDLTWAKKANERLKMELEQLEHFFPPSDSLTVEIKKEKQQRQDELMKQYHPRIDVHVINAGIFYFDES